MKNVYLVQVDVTAGSGVEVAYLPYAVGLLAANAWKDEVVSNNYTFKNFIFMRTGIEETISSLDNPAVVGFSNYCWNAEYNKLLAKRIKVTYPDCIIIFGGHNVPDNITMLEDFDYIDMLIYGEGEETFRDVLKALLDYSLVNVNNISFRNSDNRIIKTRHTIPSSLDYPSPYLEGWFDTIINNETDIQFNAILETSRGCPFRCAYCDWGLLKSKTRLFPLKRILAEIKWMSDKKIAFIWGADANFGMFKRDMEIVNALVEAKEKTGYPERMRMNYSKNNHDRVFDIAERFRDSDFDRIGTTLSFQSMSDVVLQNIGRNNMSLDYFGEILSKYNKKRIKTYSEFILGLPGETYQSFIDGIAKLFELGQHFVFEVYNCIMLPNSSLASKENIEKFKLKTVAAEMVRHHCEDVAFEIPEYNIIVVETETLSREEWVRATVFYYLVKAFHGNGLLRAFAIYLYYEKKIPYQFFYDKMLDYFEKYPNLYTSKIYFDLKEHADKISRGLPYTKMTFEPCGGLVWDDHEYAVLHLLYNCEIFYKDMNGFLKDFNIDDDIFYDLINYQINIIRMPSRESSDASLCYDLHTYFNNVYINDKKPLLARKNTTHFRDSEPAYNWKDFGKLVVWYGRMGWKSYMEDVDIEYF